MSQSRHMPSSYRPRSDASMRLEAHVKSFGEWLIELVMSAIQDRAYDNRLGFVIIGEYNTPSKNQDGSWMHPTENTHWNGDIDAPDSSIGGSPIATLLEGPIRREIGKADPKLLPRGRTSMQVLREWLQTNAPEFAVHLARSNKRLQIYLIRDHHSWEAYCTDRVETRKRDDAAQARQEGPQTMTLDEFKAQRAAQRSTTTS